MGVVVSVCLYVIYIVWSSANISDPRHIYRGPKRQGQYAAEVRYRGYGLTYHTI